MTPFGLEPLRVPMVQETFDKIRKILYGPCRHKLELAGLDKADAKAVEIAIYLVLEAIEWNLMILVKTMEQRGPERIAESIQSWVVLTTDITLFQIENALEGISESLDKYIPEDDYDDEDEDEANDA